MCIYIYISYNILFHPTSSKISKGNHMQSESTVGICLHCLPSLARRSDKTSRAYSLPQQCRTRGACVLNCVWHCGKSRKVAFGIFWLSRFAKIEICFLLLCKEPVEEVAACSSDSARDPALAKDQTPTKPTKPTKWDLLDQHANQFDHLMQHWARSEASRAAADAEIFPTTPSKKKPGPA